MICKTIGGVCAVLLFITTPCAFTEHIPDAACNTFTFDATESYDPDGQELSFLWEFGDGAKSTEQIVTHAYEKPGTYTIRLSATDSSSIKCNKETTTRTIRVNMPPKAFFTMPDLICAGEKITLDASPTQDESPSNLTFSWDFGDGTQSNGKTISKVFTKGGTYKVTLTVDDNSGTTCNKDSLSKLIKVNTGPIAHAGEDVQKCFPAQSDTFEVKFNASESQDADNDALSYFWEFGDGSKGKGKTISHIYKKCGNYAARLTVNDNSGSRCDTDLDTIAIRISKPPAAKASDNINACVATNLLFEGSDSKTDRPQDLSHSWDFGDGVIRQGKQVKHIYTQGGVYKVILTVTDNSRATCNSSTSGFTAMVNEKPVPVIKIR